MPLSLDHRSSTVPTKAGAARAGGEVIQAICPPIRGRAGLIVRALVPGDEAGGEARREKEQVVRGPVALRDSLYWRICWRIRDSPFRARSFFLRTTTVDVPSKDSGLRPAGLASRDDLDRQIGGGCWRGSRRTDAYVFSKRRHGTTSCADDLGRGPRPLTLLLGRRDRVASAAGGGRVAARPTARQATHAQRAAKAF